ncbi:uncharacterized protein N7500_006611 [Penicillium coprophilum]|uniref:uncharacterized protein n=1 Tax=Penicillium coprophilum TaxID=36646 RepID=UPI0023A47160|nr:uncharacterized protein N7500_006611 [Penicillium coprophilum]KAJ5164781.1 hypothetical protein N7500_006611 [Penicillium coprophilum]
MLPVQASEANSDLLEDQQNKLNQSPLDKTPTSVGRGLGLDGNSMTLELMQHFQESIARKLAWVDGPTNSWRQVIIPLAWVSPTVLCAVLSLSSKDLACKYAQDHPRHNDLQRISLQFRNNVLALLARQISSLREREMPQIGTFDPNEIRYTLASMLILYNVELLGAESIKWRMHLKAARIIVQWREQVSSPASLNEIDTFLLYEHYYASVFAGLTTFDPADGFTAEQFETLNDITIFSDFVRVIHRVTQIERFSYDQGFTVDPSQIANIFCEVDAARQRMAQLGQRLHLQGCHAQDFQHLVCIFYHASLIYSYQVLKHDSSANPNIHASRDSIFGHLNSLSNRETFPHDLVWPLFILGTECRGLPEMQEMVSREMEAVMKISGALDRQKVLFFLQQYWSLDLDHRVTWIHFLRDMMPGKRMLIL